LNMIDEYTKECLASIPKGSCKHTDILEIYSGLFVVKGSPGYVRSDKGSEFTTKKLRTWLMDVGVSTAYFELGSPWENGYCESFNGKVRDKFLNREIFDTMLEVEVLTRKWVIEYKTIRPHSSLGYRPHAPQAMLIAS
jgi:putative transposase